MTPYFDRDGVTIYNGDCLEVLGCFGPETVQSCVTSPPYWGLRSYGTDGQVWGGSAECDHRWGPAITTKKGGIGQQKGLNGNTHIAETWDASQTLEQGQFCQLCGGWYGSLGLEPTPELYVEHMVDIFREVRRVLREDGTLWVNLGDSYATGAGKANNPGSDARPRGDRQGEAAGKAAYQDFPACQPNRMPIEGLKPKDLVGIPWRVAFALQEDGWYLRQDIIWHKPAPMPESVRDRCTKSHEYIFLLSKSQRYYFDAEAIAEPCSNPEDLGLLRSQKVRAEAMGRKPSGNEARARGVNGGASFGKQNHDTTGTGAQSRQYERPVYDTRNKRSVWTVNTKPYPGAHFATFPPKLIEPCILAGCPEGGTVLDPFLGSGTTAAVSQQFGRQCVGIELSEEYCKLAADRFKQRVMFADDENRA